MVNTVKLTNCFSVFDHFVRLTLKGLRGSSFSKKKYWLEANIITKISIFSKFFKVTLLENKDYLNIIEAANGGTS